MTKRFSIFGLETIKFIVEEVRNHTANMKPEEVSILDMGCGTGREAIHLGSYGYRVTAIDTDASSIALARSNNSFPNVKFMIQDCLARDLPDKVGRNFNFVVCNNIMEHMVDPIEMLNNAKSVLSDTGILIITTCSGFGPTELTGKFLKATRLNKVAQKLYWYILYRNKTEDELGASLGSLNFFETHHFQSFTFGSLEGLLKRSGFIVQKAQNTCTILSTWSLQQVFPKTLQRLDIRVGSKVPKWAAGGWYFVLTRAPAPD